MEFVGEILFVVVQDTGVAHCFDIFRRGQSEHAVAETHCFEQRRVRAADFGGVNVAVSVLLQGAVVLTKNKSGEDDALVAAGSGLEIADVVVRVRGVADDQEPVRRPHFLECFDDQMRVVFRFQARDIQHITIRLDAPLAHRIAIGATFDLRAVGNHGRRRVVASQVVVLDDARIGDGSVGQDCGQAFGKHIVFLCDPVPLFSFVLETVNVDRDRRSGKSQ